MTLKGTTICAVKKDGKIVKKYRLSKDKYTLSTPIARASGENDWHNAVFRVKLLYTIAPDKKIPSHSTTYGSIFTTVIWTIATAIFSYYLKYFANYNMLYGNLSSIIILMMWIYIISYVFVMGIAINATNLNEKWLLVLSNHLSCPYSSAE